MKAAKPQKGFTLIELMVSVAILGILASATSEAFKQFGNRRGGGTPAMDRLRLASWLRDDFWIARETQIGKGPTLHLWARDGREIRWKLEGQNLVRVASWRGKVVDSRTLAKGVGNFEAKAKKGARQAYAVSLAYLAKGAEPFYLQVTPP